MACPTPRAAGQARVHRLRPAKDSLPHPEQLSESARALLRPPAVQSQVLRPTRRRSPRPTGNITNTTLRHPRHRSCPGNPPSSADSTAPLGSVRGSLLHARTRQLADLAQSPIHRASLRCLTAKAPYQPTHVPCAQDAFFADGLTRLRACGAHRCMSGYGCHGCLSGSLEQARHQQRLLGVREEAEGQA